MIYSVENTAGAGRPVRLVRDANGNVVSGKDDSGYVGTVACIEIDTETGRVYGIEVDSCGKLVIENDETKKITSYFPPPLKLVFYDEEEKPQTWRDRPPLL